MMPILQRTLESMNHVEAEEETADAMMMMIDTVRDQTLRLEELFGLEESKVASLVQSSTKRSTYKPNDSASLYGGSVMSQSIMSSSGPTGAKTEQGRTFEKK